MIVVVAVVATVVLAAVYVTWLAARIDRLHARVEAAYASLDAQLVRRAAAALALSAALPPAPGEALRTAARGALDASPSGREGAENDLSRALFRLSRTPAAGPPGAPGPAAGLLADLSVTATKVGYARQFHNDAVRDTRALRGRRMPRLLGLSRTRALPVYFEIADTVPPAPATLRPAG